MPTTKTRSSARTRRTRSASGKSPQTSGKSSSRSLKKTPKPENGKEGTDNRSQLETLFIDSLKDIYWAEKHLTKALPKMKKAASTDELISAIEEHLAQTEEHVSRLEQVFEICGKKAQAKKCDGMEGLTKEGDSVIGETEKGSMTRDAGIIMAAQKVEHYEIATYGTLVQFARTLGMDEAAEILEQTLEEEKETDQRLTEIAESNINQEAEQESDDDKEDEDEEDDDKEKNDAYEEEEK